MARWLNESIFLKGGRLKMDLTGPAMIPIFGIVAGTAMIVIIVVTSLWSKTRERELQMHSEMRIREMEHQRKMKELELEIEKTKAEHGTAIHA
jgi:FtsZ-interacting cell division protein ZipA